MKTAILFFSWPMSWVIWLPLCLPAFGITTIPKLPFNHRLGAWGPLLAGVFLTWLRKESQGWKFY